MMSTVVLENVAWETYQRLLFEVGEQARLTYDRGCLEIEMSPLLKHEAPKRLLESIVEFFCEEHEIPFLPLGSTTFSLEEKRQGTEPDSGFILGERANISEDYTESAPETMSPDLVIEVDVTSPSVGKDSLYHTLGVQEIWRWRGARLRILSRAEQGFTVIECSRLLPGAQSDRVTELVLQGQKTTQIAWRKQVRAWARGEN
jgi:Uma2 family endonuclease